MATMKFQNGKQRFHVHGSQKFEALLPRFVDFQSGSSKHEDAKPDVQRHGWVCVICPLEEERRRHQEFLCLAFVQRKWNIRLSWAFFSRRDLYSTTPVRFQHSGVCESVLLWSFRTHQGSPRCEKCYFWRRLAGNFQTTVFLLQLELWWHWNVIKLICRMCAPLWKGPLCRNIHHAQR